MSFTHSPPGKRGAMSFMRAARRLAGLSGLFLVAAVAPGFSAPGPAAASAPAEVPFSATTANVAPGTLQTVAGGFGEGAKATEVAIMAPSNVEVGPGGDLYVTAGRSVGAVLRVDADTGEMSRAAGSGFSSPGPVGPYAPGYWPIVGGDGGRATHAKMGWPSGVAFDAAGNMFIADQTGGQLRRVDAKTGIITTVAGDGHRGDGSGGMRPECAQGAPAGDGGPATKVCLRHPVDVAVAGDGSVYVAEYIGDRVRKVRPDGTITTVAGIGEPGFCGDGGPAAQACLYSPQAVALDATGSLFIAEFLGDRVRRVDAATGVITTVAGGGQRGFCGDGGPATQACLNGPTSVAVDSVGGLLIADRRNHRVRRVDAATGVITTVAGTGEETVLEPNHWEVYADNGDGGPATKARLGYPTGVAVGPAGVVYVADQLSNRVRRVDPETGVITTVAGNGAHYFSGDGGPATQAVLGAATGGAVDAAGNFYFVDQYHFRVRRVDAATGIITTVAGRAWPDTASTALQELLGNRTEDWAFWSEYPGDGKPATEVMLGVPTDVDVDEGGNLYIAESWGNRIRRVDAGDGIITTVAGTGDRGYAGDGGLARLARLDHPHGVDVDAVGNVFIADWGSCHVRRVDADTGVITTVAGMTGLDPAAVPGGKSVSDLSLCGYSGDGGQATQAKLSHVSDVAVDTGGNVFIADSGFRASDLYQDDQHFNHVVRKVDADTGVITTVAGTPEQFGGSGDGGPANRATLYTPVKIAVDAAGDLFIADYYNHRVRRVDADTGVITTVAGTGEWAYRGAGRLATSAPIGNPNGVAVSPQGDLFITDDGFPGSTWNVRWNPDRVYKVVGIAKGTPPGGIPANLTPAELVGSQAKPRQTVLTTTVANTGGSDASSVVVRFFDGDTLIGGSAPVNVAAGESATASLIWDTRKIKGERRITAVADPDNTVTESDEDDNTITRAITIRGNKVKNGSYEQSSPGESPDGWSGGAGSGYDTSGSHATDGAAAVSLTGQGLGGAGTWTSAPIAVNPGETYQLAVTAATEGASSTPTVKIEFLDVDGRVLNTVTGITANLTGDNPATELTGQVTVPQGAPQLRIVLAGWAPTDPKPTGTVRFDDVWLW